MRKILYITGTRADFGLMQGVLRAIDAAPDLDLSVAVTGMHLSDQYGATAQEISAAGFRVAGEVPVPLEPATGATMARNIGTMLGGFTDIMVAQQPDIVLLLGDRGEMLAGAIAGIHLNIAVAHIHGGERSGTVDEAVRHAVSKLAHIHLVATPESQKRLVAMGENPFAIFNVGAPGLDGLSDLALTARDDLMRSHGLDPAHPFALLVYHPVLQEADRAESQMRVILQILESSGTQLLALKPNSDAGSAGVRAALDETTGRPGLTVLTHLPRSAFLNAIAAADVMIGNSSSAIIEAASFGTPVVNIGTRQNLRDRNANVRDVSNDPQAIARAVTEALSGPRYPIANIYGDGHSAARIVEILRSIALDADLMNKVNLY